MNMLQRWTKSLVPFCLCMAILNFGDPGRCSSTEGSDHSCNHITSEHVDEISFDDVMNGFEEARNQIGKIHSLAKTPETTNAMTNLMNFTLLYSKKFEKTVEQLDDRKALSVKNWFLSLQVHKAAADVISSLARAYTALISNLNATGGLVNHRNASDIFSLTAGNYIKLLLTVMDDATKYLESKPIFLTRDPVFQSIQEIGHSVTELAQATSRIFRIPDQLSEENSKLSLGWFTMELENLDFVRKMLEESAISQKPNLLTLVEHAVIGMVDRTRFNSSDNFEGFKRMVRAPNYEPISVLEVFSQKTNAFRKLLEIFFKVNPRDKLPIYQTKLIRVMQNDVNLMKTSRNISTKDSNTMYFVTELHQVTGLIAKLLLEKYITKFTALKAEHILDLMIPSSEYMNDLLKLLDRDQVMELRQHTGFDLYYYLLKQMITKKEKRRMFLSGVIVKILRGIVKSPSENAKQWSENVWTEAKILMLEMLKTMKQYVNKFNGRDWVTPDEHNHPDVHCMERLFRQLWRTMYFASSSISGGDPSRSTIPHMLELLRIVQSAIKNGFAVSDFLQNRTPWRNFVQLVDFTNDLLGELYEAKKINAEFLAKNGENYFSTLFSLRNSLNKKDKSFLRNEVIQMEDKMSLLEYKWRNLLSPIVNLLKQLQ